MISPEAHANLPVFRSADRTEENGYTTCFSPMEPDWEARILKDSGCSGCWSE